MKRRCQHTNFVPLSFPTKEEWLENEFKFDRMIRKNDLNAGQIYIGNCRNADVAYWVHSLDLFVYVRSKFGATFLESINHPENDDGYDSFLPHVAYNEVEDPDSINHKCYFGTTDEAKVRWEEIKRERQELLKFLKDGEMSNFIKEELKRRKA